MSSIQFYFGFFEFHLTFQSPLTVTDVSEAMLPTMEILSRGSQDRRAASISDVVISKQCNYVPDFTVKAISDVEYLRIARPHYIAAVRATCLERSPSNEAAEAWRSMDSSCE